MKVLKIQEFHKLFESFLINHGIKKYNLIYSGRNF